MGLARIGRLASVAAAWLLVTSAARATGSARTIHVDILADRDDDDLDGVADGDQLFLPPAARVDLLPVAAALIGRRLRLAAASPSGAPPRTEGVVRIVHAGKVVPWGDPIPTGAMVQGVAAGVVVLHAEALAHSESPLTVSITVRALSLRDSTGANVDWTRDHASLSRTPPSRVEGEDALPTPDSDALRVVLERPVVSASSDDLASPETTFRDLKVTSLSAAGADLDLLRVPLTKGPCAPAYDGDCASTDPLRLVVDEVDEKHPLVRARSLRAEVGGALVVHVEGQKQAIRVAGPRRSPVGPIGRLRATLRPFVLRVVPGGTPAVGGNDAGAVLLVRGEIALASAVWGQCGLTFGPPGSIDVRVIDPPPPYLVAFGDDLGLPAAGGEVRVRVDGHLLAVPMPPGTVPRVAADRFARAAEESGLVAAVSPNARTVPGAAGSVDVLLRHIDGRLATVDVATPGAAPSTDTSLVVRIGSVDLTDGLQHFGDLDAVAGTLEERTLLKALDDGDPRTLEVIVIPWFAGGGRIGESFISSDHSSMRNAVVIDRGGIRARRSSLTLAHELGHVLLNIPGHPDDYGADTPTRLMDSDGSDASPFGPRRLTVDECARVVRESGPLALVPLLTPMPLTPLRVLP